MCQEPPGKGHRQFGQTRPLDRPLDEGASPGSSVAKAEVCQGDEEFMSAIGAADACETVMQIAALEELVDGLTRRARRSNTRAHDRFPDWTSPPEPKERSPPVAEMSPDGIGTNESRVGGLDDPRKVIEACTMELRLTLWMDLVEEPIA